MPSICVEKQLLGDDCTRRGVAMAVGASLVASFSPPRTSCLLTSQAQVMVSMTLLYLL